MTTRLTVELIQALSRFISASMKATKSGIVVRGLGSLQEVIGSDLHVTIVPKKSAAIIASVPVKF